MSIGRARRKPGEPRRHRARARRAQRGHHAAWRLCGPVLPPPQRERRLGRGLRDLSRRLRLTVMGDYRIAYDANGGTGAPATEESRAAAATLETAGVFAGAHARGVCVRRLEHQGRRDGNRLRRGRASLAPLRQPRPHPLCPVEARGSGPGHLGPAGREGSGSSTSPRGEKNGVRGGDSTSEKSGTKKASARQRAGVPETGDATTNVPLFLLGAAIPLRRRRLHPDCPRAALLSRQRREPRQSAIRE